MQVSKTWWAGLLVGALCACGPGLSTGGTGGEGGTPNPLPKLLQVPEVTVAEELGSEIVVSVTGSDFVRSSVLQVNGVAVSTTFVSSTQLTATFSLVHYLLEGSTLSVFTPPPGGGRSEEVPVPLILPVVESVEPATLDDPPRYCSAILRGRNFLWNATVQRVGGAALSTTHNDLRLIQVNLPPEECGVAREFDVVVQNPGGGTSEPVTLAVVNPRPALNEVSPRMIAASGFAMGNGASATLVLRGTGILRSATQVRWNGLEVETSSDRYGQVSAVIPQELFPASGQAQVTLYNPPPGGGSSEPLEVVLREGPVLTQLMPGSSATVAGEFTIRVDGSGFRAPMTLYWGHNARPTRVLGPNTLEADIAYSDTLLPGVARITVRRDDGTVSNPVSYYISDKHHAPVLEYAWPSTLPAGSGAATVLLQGAGFHRSSRVLWNGQERPTDFSGIWGLRVSLSAEDLQQAGVASLTVSNPAPGGSSLSVPFNVEARRDVPFLRVIEPWQVQAGSGDLTLKLVGFGFHPESVVRWNGTPVPTVFGGRLEYYQYGYGDMVLSATVPAALLSTAGSAEVTVSTPAPGGGLSNPKTLAIQAPGAWRLNSLSPTSVELGTQQVTLQVHRAFDEPGFEPASAVVRVGGRDKLPLPSSTSSTLVVALDAVDLSAAGPLPVRVQVAERGLSAPLFFDVIPPQKPKLWSINPGVVSVEAWNRTQPGGVRVYGENLRGPNLADPLDALDTLLLWNDTPVPLIPDTGTHSGSIDLGEDETRTAGTIRVSLSRPGASGGEESLPAFVNVTEQRPVPSAWVLIPSSAPKGGPALHLSVFGAGFQPSSVVYWNGMPLATRMEGVMLAATVPAEALGTAGEATVVVSTPAPGGGTSMPMLFHVSE